MRKTFSVPAIAALIALPLAFGPTDASASCQGRKNTGTAIGAIGGALLGNAIASGGGKTGGTIIGGLGGAVVGHEIAKGGCAPARTAYRTTRTRYATNTSNYAQPVARKVYYDQYGNPIVATPASGYYAR